MADSNTKPGFLERHSRTINILAVILLVSLCTTSYILLILLFTKSQAFNISSLSNREDSRISPTVAIPLVVAVLSGATLALVTIAVEHDLWISIMDKPGQICGDEAYRRAQWSVSTLSRLGYMINGESWALRCSALLLLGCAILSPVLLYGVNPAQSIESSEEHIGADSDSFEELGTQLYYTDGLLASHDMNPPVSSLCRDGTCAVDAQAFSLLASCNSWVVVVLDALADGWDTVNVTACSQNDTSLCVSFNPWTVWANFTTGPSTNYTALTYEPDHNFFNAMSWDGWNLAGAKCSGEFATIFGLVTNDARTSNQTTYAVDCRVQYGNRSIRQVGRGTPTLSEGSFVKSAVSLAMVDRSLLLSQWQLVYNNPNYEPETEGASAFGFILSELQDATPFGNGLLDDAAGSWPFTTGEEVSRRIEAVFDTWTLLCYARYPGTSIIKITVKTERGVWHYDPKVLWILVVPLLASILVLSTNLRIGGTDKVIGYDPVRIAKNAEKVLIGVRQEGKRDENLEPTAALDEEESKSKEAPSSVTSNLLTREEEPAPRRNGARTW